MEVTCCSMEIEDSRTYLDKLFCDDHEQQRNALITLKNAVIGSNRQKTSVISQGIVPRLISLITQNDNHLDIRLDSIIVIGSLAKGNIDHVRSLIDYNIVTILLSLISTPNIDSKIIEMSLCTLRTIFQYTFAPTALLYSNIETLSHLIELASAHSTIETQACVANILVPLCHSYDEQMILCQAGTIPFLARMMSTQYAVLQIPALKCLASMCLTNRSVSDIVCVTNYEGKSLPDILSYLLSRVRDPEIQLSAARCLTYIHRSGTLPSTDIRIAYKTLPCLARLCTEEFKQEIRATAAETLAYLAEVDSQLQRLAAISNHLITSLSQLLQIPLPLPRQGAFRCFASLGANDEDIRKRIIETKGLMEKLLEGLGDNSAEVRLSSVRCLHSLSRSVQQLRTTFQDHTVWRPLMAILTSQPSNELLFVVTSTVCNLLLEFSPAKEPMLESGILEILCLLTENSDPALRLNGCWALMNVAFQAEQSVKTKIIETLGNNRILKLLNDSDTRVIMKTLGLLRNLLSKSVHIDSLMTNNSNELIQAVNMVLDSNYSIEVKEQALCIFGNIVTGAQSKNYILEGEKMLKRLAEFLIHRDVRLQAGALFVIGNLVQQTDLGGSDKFPKLKEAVLSSKLAELLNMTANNTEFYEEIRMVIKEFEDP